jgi:transcriptional regulator with XRE-family HTH domain
MKTPAIVFLRTRLKKIRNANKISQVKFAPMIGLNYKYYQSVEAGGRRDLRIGTLAGIAKALKLPLFKLLDPATPIPKIQSGKKS